MLPHNNYPIGNGALCAVLSLVIRGFMMKLSLRMPVLLLVFLFTSGFVVATEIAFDPQEIPPLNERALLAHQQGDYRQAARLYQQLLPMVAQHFGEQSRERALILSSLADTQLSLRQYLQAEEYYQAALVILQAIADGRGQAIVLNGLAASLYLRRQYGKAEPLFKQALELLEQLPAPDVQNRLLVLDNLASLYKTIRRNNLAEEYQSRANLLRQVTQGPGQPADSQSR
ncbi:kinesin light chain-like protein [Cellvibrio japonicus Ueda107]|uniref:Kinesin light chain-like protein n=2 Tax=Cellvibrio japonicus TaxID=155077 RepID=B3PLQ6_CELJU|nr:kinesin light chain-like protein [Cellvibrio japonicus Ueda107]QEI13038.1 tetratricopeptide repeat protein [Cellvibrio japonicus]QEI16612.1 tetratricopeptide repeat protein [Cellvibrio japonicus]QEI20190.1 tetratricopeptide repeat protein [Cellvibrio japonicus]